MQRGGKEYCVVLFQHMRVCLDLRQHTAHCFACLEPRKKQFEGKIDHAH